MVVIISPIFFFGLPLATLFRSRGLLSLKCPLSLLPLPLSGKFLLSCLSPVERRRVDRPNEVIFIQDAANLYATRLRPSVVGMAGRGKWGGEGGCGTVVAGSWAEEVAVSIGRFSVATFTFVIFFSYFTDIEK